MSSAYISSFTFVLIALPISAVITLNKTGLNGSPCKTRHVCMMTFDVVMLSYTVIWFASRIDLIVWSS